MLQLTTLTDSTHLQNRKAHGYRQDLQDLFCLRQDPRTGWISPALSHAPGEKWKGHPRDEDTAQTLAKKSQEWCKKEMSTVRNTWLILHLNLSSIFNCTFGLYLYLLTSKALHIPVCYQRGEGTQQNLTALQMLFSKSGSLWEFHIWQRAWAIFTKVHISAVLISVIISFLFTTILWQQGTNNHKQEKNTNLNAWLRKKEEDFCTPLYSKQDLTSNPRKW